jgi:hypothetical protein
VQHQYCHKERKDITIIIKDTKSTHHNDAVSVNGYLRAAKVKKSCYGGESSSVNQVAAMIQDVYVHTYLPYLRPSPSRASVSASLHEYLFPGENTQLLGIDRFALAQATLYDSPEFNGKF